jgi:hypothetical protein
MYCRLPFEYSFPGRASATLFPATPSKEITYVFPIREFSRKSNVALLLRRSLHNFSALAPVNHSDGITCGEFQPKSRKSNAALLLPHVFAVSPLLRYSYKKMGCRGTKPNILNWGHVSSPHRVQCDANYQCFLSLTRIPARAQKRTQCFLSLTDLFARKYLCFLSLTKKAG